MGRPLPVGADTDEPTALLYLNPVEFRAVRRLLAAANRLPLSETEQDVVDSILDKMTGKGVLSGS